ncbi:MAG: hypothetical protein ACRELC_07120, partial [Gemmatimonadota bacterium]
MLGLALLASCVVAARAQQPGDPATWPSDPATLASDPAHASPYLPLDHWAYPVLDYWISMGRIDDLSPLVQPYRRLDVARAIEALLGQPLSDVEEKWLLRLEEELEPEIERLSGTLLPAGRMALRARVGASYASQTHRDPLRPALDGPFSADRVLERAFLEGRGEIGPLAAGFRVGRDGMFLHDAQFPDGRVVPRKVAPVLDELGVRVEEAYVELQTEHAAVGFGRLYRNWGLPGAFGFARSDYAYTEEELFYRFGFDRLYVTGSLASLRDFAGDTTRYLSMHRLEARPAKSLVLAVTEAAIHGGPSQPLDLALVNPLGIWNIARVDGEPRK